jgi:hypothetical protein
MSLALKRRTFDEDMGRRAAVFQENAEFMWNNFSLLGIHAEHNA